MSRTLIAFVLSCLVYLVPIVHGHGGTILGIYLWVMLVDGRGEFDPLWKALDIGLAVALHVSWFLALRWILLGSWVRWLLLVGLVPATAVTVVLSYLVLIPTLFLIESDDLPETGSWPVACSVSGAATAGLPTGVTLALERAGEAWIHSRDGGYGVLSGPDCRIVPRKLFFPGVYGSVGHVAPGGAVYYRMDSDGDGQFEHWYLDGDRTTPQRLDAPARIDPWMPVVDAGSGALAWLETQRADNRRVLGHVIVVRPLADGPQLRIPLHMEATSSPRLLDFDLAAGRFIVLRNYRAFYVVGLDGWAAEAPVEPAGFDHVGTNFRLLAGGWVAWDGYRENARYRIGWSLPSGAGVYEIAKGRGITAVSVNPAGHYIAVSVSGTLSIGSVRDSVRVVKVADGTEVWRRYMPRYTRSQVAFLGSGHLAVTQVQDSDVRIDVLEVPAR
jgi:hypothetical protein